MSEFIKKPELLRESNRTSDFLNYDTYARNLYKNLISDAKPSVTTLIGGYGTGKTVLLGEVRKMTEQSKAKQTTRWVFFECWQYPDKSDLWEALIIELVGAVGGEGKKNRMLKQYSDIPSWRSEIASFLNNTNTAVASVLGIGLFVFFAWSWAPEDARSILIALFTSVILVLLASIELFVKPISYSSVSRLNDYKSELEDILKDHEGALYIVLEDVDRAGELGRRFFETVAHFVHEGVLVNKNIKVVVPVSNLDQEGAKPLRDAVEKASDNILYFNPHYDSTKFIEQLFEEEFLDEKTKLLLVEMTNILLGKSISVRKMKHIFRNAVIKYKRLKNNAFQPYLQICIAVEFSKYMNGTAGTRTLFEQASSNFEHKILFRWAESAGMIDRNPPDEKSFIEDRAGRFKRVDDDFEGVRYEDTIAPGRSTAGKQIYYRDYLISRLYFEDL